MRALSTDDDEEEDTAWKESFSSCSTYRRKNPTLMAPTVLISDEVAHAFGIHRIAQQ